MTVRDLYKEAILGKHKSLLLLIDFLVKEKKVIQMTEPADKITYYLQEKYHKKMSEYLARYREEDQQPYFKI